MYDSAHILIRFGSLGAERYVCLVDQRVGRR